MGISPLPTYACVNKLKLASTNSITLKTALGVLSRYNIVITFRTYLTHTGKQKTKTVSLHSTMYVLKNSKN